MSKAINEMSREEMLALVQSMQGTIDQMKADHQRKLSCKVSDKGAVSVYGLGKWPVTLYRSQWEAFVPFIKSGAVERFIEANASQLSVKA